jgi:signal transduction histidine kinase/integral membrane sensor domain MASE1
MERTGSTTGRWTALRSRDARLVGSAVLVAVAYYLGCRLGFALKFGPMTPSVLWPPNALLTATLLLAPPRQWWVYVLAVLPVHVAVQLSAGIPAPLTGLLFLTNWSEALIAAVGVRRFSDGPPRFDTLRRVMVFIGAAGLAAPFLSSFADAGAVWAFRGESYWAVWRTRFFSNVLTELTLVPALVMLVSAGPSWIRTASRRHHLEAALLAIALVPAAILGFGGVVRIPGAPLAFVLPLLLWAAVRFGPGGLSLALVTSVWVAIILGLDGHGPFTTLPVSEAVVALQIFLSVATIPLMCLAGVLEERRQAQAALEERLHFEALLARLSGAFVRLPSDGMDDAIREWLARLGEFFSLRWLTLTQVSDQGSGLPIEHTWTAPHLHDTGTARVPPADGPEKTGSPESEVVMGFPMGFPLLAASRSLGILTFSPATRDEVLLDALLQRLSLTAEVFAAALARKHSEDALRASELMKSAILGSLSSTVAVLDRTGAIIAVNQGWARIASALGAVNGEKGVGASYLALCRRAARQGSTHAGEVLAGVEAVLEGARPTFTLEYPVRSGDRERWLALSVVPLRRPDGGAIVSHTDVTERKHAEIDAQRSRQELAHFTRVSTMGELAASLAHELSQPLTGILSNAQAARRFLQAPAPDLDELREILDDILQDDRRAGDVVQRLRELLRKEEPRLSPLDLNTLVLDVAKILGSDAIIRNVSIALELDPALPRVNGERVQLQQVVLNLLVNAMDAMTETNGGDRTVLVRTENTEAQAVHLSVRDCGTGLRDGSLEDVFRPFYTTKPAGMGMGLTISRSIVKAHGGLIWATNNDGQGATFHVALPVEPPQ